MTLFFSYINFRKLYYNSLHHNYKTGIYKTLYFVDKALILRSLLYNLTISSSSRAKCSKKCILQIGNRRQCMSLAQKLGNPCISIFICQFINGNLTCFPWHSPHCRRCKGQSLPKMQGAFIVRIFGLLFKTGEIG